MSIVTASFAEGFSLCCFLPAPPSGYGREAGPNLIVHVDRLLVVLFCVVVRGLLFAPKLVDSLVVAVVVFLGHLVVGDVTFEVRSNKIAPRLSSSPFSSFPC
jgi:hypothetical protein